MSSELKNVEKKVGIDTHIHPTSLKLEKKYNKRSSWFNISWQDNFNANNGRIRQAYFRRGLV